MQDQLNKLKAIALDQYDADGGEMFECFDDADYLDLLEGRTADEAWALHLRIVEASREAGGFYERF